MKRLNEYATAAGLEVYELIPKAVWAAIAVSSLTRAHDELDDALSTGDTTAIADAIRDEWQVLHQNGIVPQRPARIGERP